MNLQLKSLVKALQPDLETAQNRFARLVKILSDLSGQLLHKGGHEALVAATTHPEEELFKLPKPSEQDDDAAVAASAEPEATTVSTAVAATDRLQDRNTTAMAKMRVWHR